jgi:hypothetical protein
MSPGIGLLRPLLRLVATLPRLLGLALTALFGRISWTPPGWSHWLGAGFAAGGRRIAAHPRRTAGFVAGLLAAVVGGFWGYAWWEAQPRPVLVRFTVANPPRTEIEKDKPPHPVVVTFERSVAPLASIGKDVASGIRATPAVAGTWRWDSDRVLKLLPKDDWLVGAEYTVAFEKTVVTSDTRLAEYGFRFQTAPFVLTVPGAQFHQDPTNPALKKAVIELSFSHPVNAVELEKRIELRLAGQSTGILGVGKQTTRFTISYDKLKLAAYIHSDPLPIPKTDTTLSVAIDKGVVAARGGRGIDQLIAQTIQVPGLYSLQVADVGPIVATGPANEPDQVLVVQMSASVAEKEMQKSVVAWVLPVQNPRVTEGRSERFDWSDPGEITDAVLKQSTRLTLEPIAAEREHTETHSFKYRADVGRYVYVRIEKGVQSFGGYLLGERLHRIVQVPEFPPELRILSQGALLAMSGERKVAVLVRDLPGVRVEVGRILPSQLQHLVSQAEGESFTNPEFYQRFGPDNLTERFERKVSLPKLPHGRAHYHPVDLSEYL